MSSETSTFDRILSRLDESDGVTEKTASEEAPAASSESVMLDTVRRVSDAYVTKTASATPTPASSLETMAKQAADLEEENLIKQAKTMGAFVCDGFFERYAAYDTALQGQAKTAATSPDALVQAKEEGRKEASAELEKQAQTSFNEGYENTMQAVYKTAAEIHYQGQAVARQLLNESKQG